MNREAEANFDAARETLLCAEDHPDLRRHICGLLRSDYNVFVAADGHEALRLARATSPASSYRPDDAQHQRPRAAYGALRSDEGLSSDPGRVPDGSRRQPRPASKASRAERTTTSRSPSTRASSRPGWRTCWSRAQERQLAALNRRLEARVDEQLAELVRTGELKRFLPQRVVEGVLTGRIASRRDVGADGRPTALFVTSRGSTRSRRG